MDSLQATDDVENQKLHRMVSMVSDPLEFDLQARNCMSSSPPSAPVLQRLSETRNFTFDNTSLCASGRTASMLSSPCQQTVRPLKSCSDVSLSLRQSADASRSMSSQSGEPRVRLLCDLMPQLSLSPNAFYSPRPSRSASCECAAGEASDRGNENSTASCLRCIDKLMTLPRAKTTAGIDILRQRLSAIPEVEHERSEDSFNHIEHGEH